MFVALLLVVSCYSSIFTAAFGFEKIRLQNVETLSSVPAGKSFGGIASDYYGKLVVVSQNFPKTTGDTTGSAVYYANDGRNFYQTNCPYGMNYGNVAMSSSGWSGIVAGSGACYTTMDAGAHWTSNNHYCSSVAFSTAGQTMMSVYKTDQSSCMYRSRSGGATWEFVYGPAASVTGGKSYICSAIGLDYSSETIVLALNGYGIVTSKDSGATWQPTLVLPDTAFSVVYGGVFFYVVGTASATYGTIYKSKDGLDWMATNGPTNLLVHQLSAAANNGNLLVAAADTLFYSNDTGNSFYQVDTMSQGTAHVGINGDGTILFWSAATGSTDSPLQIYRGQVVMV